MIACPCMADMMFVQEVVGRFMKSKCARCCQKTASGPPINDNQELSHTGLRYDRRGHPTFPPL